MLNRFFNAVEEGGVVVLPLVKPGLKDSVLEVLSKKPWLSTKELRVELKDDYSLQGLHKSLAELFDANVVLKKNKKYALNPSWLARVNDFSRNANAAYSNSVPDFSVFTVNSLAELGASLLDLCLRCNSPEKSVLCMRWPHLWVPISVSNNIVYPDMYEHLRELMSKHDVYSITPSNTILDQSCAFFWKKMGVKVKLNVSKSFLDNVIVLNDLVFEVFYPQSILNALDKTYSIPKSLREIELGSLVAPVFDRGFKIPVLIVRDAVLASHLKKEMLALFE